jgi:hypothetical protein
MRHRFQFWYHSQSREHYCCWEESSVAHVRIEDRTVIVSLAWWERLFAGRRARIAVPAAAVLRADCVERPTAMSATPGGRAGLVVTGMLKVGRWGIGTGTHRFVSARRGVPSLRLVLDGDQAAQLGYDELLISTPDAARLAAALPAPR